MTPYAALIDPAEFGLIADYLRIPGSPIFHLLHVKSKEALVELAEELERQEHVDSPPWLFPEPVDRGLREGAMLISTHRSFRSPNPEQVIDPNTIPRDALSSVLYVPPFYLVHTPGLFEGTLIRASVEHNPSEVLQQKHMSRIKI